MDARLESGNTRAKTISWQLASSLQRSLPLALSAMAWAFGVVLLALALTGCEEDCVNCLLSIPPAVPAGVYSVTGDGKITLYWDYLEYPDRKHLVAYNVYRRDSEDGPLDSAEWERLGSVPVDQPYDDFTYRYVDYDVINSFDYEYYVTAVNDAGNESLPSYETVIDTPRPEGYNLELHDLNLNPALSGFNFSALSPAGRTDPREADTPADIYVVFENDVPYVQTARAGVSLQDFGTFLEEVYDEEGYVIDTIVRLDWVSWAPLEGYSQTGRAELIYGHAYIVEIFEDDTDELHYAKFAVTSIRSDSHTVEVAWAYQEVEGLPELKGTNGRDNVVLDFEPIKF
jgi:hypothetical protein